MTTKEKIRKHLEKGKSITPIEALNKFGCFRLAARIHDLRDEGMLIKTEKVTTKGKTYAKYIAL